MASRIAGITIEIGAETAKLSSALKGIDKDLKSTQSSLRDVDKLLKFNPGNTELLTQKQKLLGEAIEETKDRLDVLNSVAESGDLGAEEYDALQREIIETQSKLENYQSQLEENQSATDELTSTISDQQSELDDLKSAYVDAVLEFGEGSEQAQELADSISEVSGELKENQDALSQAQASADSFDKTLADTEESESGVGEAASGMASLFSGSMGSMVGAVASFDVIEIIGEIADVIKEVGEKAVEVAQEWDDACAVIAQGTGATGEALDDLAESAKQAKLELADEDATFEGVANTLAEINTRLGLSGDEAESATLLFQNYAKATGEDAATSVDALVDALKRWYEDPSIQNISTLMDDITTSSQACSLSAGDMTSLLADNAYQFQQLGFSSDEALGFITAFADGGGNTERITSALQKAVTNLTAATDDVPGSFQTAMDMIEASGGDMSVLEEEVGDTGLTIEDVFGTKAAQEMVGSIGSMGDSVDVFTEALKINDGITQQTADDATTLADNWSKLKEDMSESVWGDGGETLSNGLNDVITHFDDVVTGKTTISDCLSELGDDFLTYSETADAANGTVAEKYGYTAEELQEYGRNMSETQKQNWENMKTNTEEKFESMKNTAVNKFENMKTSVGSKATTIASDVKSKFESMKTSASEKFSNMATLAGTKFETLKTNITTKMNTAKTNFTNAINNMRNALNFSWKLPDLKVPHITVTGGVAPYGIGGEGSLPQFHVQWYAKAMDHAMLLSNAAIFGAMGGNLLGGGEAGREVVSGESHLVDLIGQTFDSRIGTIESLLSTYLPQCATSGTGSDLSELFSATTRLRRA